MRAEEEGGRHARPRNVEAGIELQDLNGTKQAGVPDPATCKAPHTPPPALQPGTRHDRGPTGSRFPIERTPTPPPAARNHFKSRSKELLARTGHARVPSGAGSSSGSQPSDDAKAFLMSLKNLNPNTTVAMRQHSLFEWTVGHSRTGNSSQGAPEVG